MIINELSISPDGKQLIINVHIPEEEGYEDLYITKIAIQDHKHYTVGYPEKPQLELNHEAELPYYINGGKQVIKIFDIEKLVKDSKLKKTGLYFVYIYQAGNPGANLSCEESLEYYTYGVMDMSSIYEKAVKLIVKAREKCEQVSKDLLLDLYWRRTALLDALRLKDFSLSIVLYEDLFPHNNLNCNSLNLPKHGCKKC